MSQFSITRLAGGRAVVKGQDFNGVENSIVVSTAQWDEVTGHDQYSKARDAFDRAVESFFAPLEKAADALEQAMARPEDPAGYVVLQEGQEAQPAVREHLVRLSHDSIVLRLVEQGDYDRLMWVKDNLEVIEAVPSAGAGVSVSDDGTSADA